MRKNNAGFTLIEVLIALVVLAIGLLGMSSLMMTSMQSNQSAYLRSQASLLAFDIAERMRANNDEATGTNNYVLLSTTTSVADPSCPTGGCSPSQQAQLDLHEWRMALTNSIPGSTATISRTNVNEYVVTIAWTESSSLRQATDSQSFELRVNL